MTLVSNRFSLSGKTAIVTGGAGLLGREHAIALTNAGAAVVLLDNNGPALEEAVTHLRHQSKHSVVDSFLADISDEDQLKDILSQLIARDQAPDVLVNNAALNPKMKSNSTELSGTVEHYDMDLWQKEIQVGITGTFLCCKVFGSNMAERKSGTIVNIASDLAIQAPDQRVYSPTGKMQDVRNFKPIGYSVTKSAMLGLNRYLASYWAHKGIRVNCLIPGAVFNDQPETLVAQVKERVPLGRWAEKHEYAEALIFLASEASSYMTGKEIVLDGGRSIW